MGIRRFINSRCRNIHLLNYECLIDDLCIIIESISLVFHLKSSCASSKDRLDRCQHFPGIAAHTHRKIPSNSDSFDASAWKIKFSSNHHSRFIFLFLALLPSSASRHFKHTEWKRLLDGGKSIYSLSVVVWASTYFFSISLRNRLRNKH